MVSPYFVAVAGLLSIFALSVNVHEVGAATPYPFPDHIGILLSDTCITMLQNNFTTDCPTYEEIMEIYPDTSDHSVSGGFAYNEFGFYEREKPIMKKHLRFYTFKEDLTQWIDPPADLLLGGHEKIIIAANPFEYKILDQTITNASHYVGNNRFVSGGCDYAIVSAAYWVEWVGDSLYYLLNKCDPEFTRYNATSLKKWEGTEHNIQTSEKWIRQKWLDEAKQECLTNCNYITNITNPSTNPDHIPETNGVNYTIHLEETLSFSDGSTNQANYTELTPCEVDPKSLLCKVWKYNNEDHEVNQSSYLKFRNAIAGAMNYNE